ncbi:RNA polymerase sigma factor [Puia dinghuensis]|uniref:RNA polymerase sigma factor n=1 Tax=Puia dinghuensis TaxID=1792502 RepID=UPI00166AFA58|nr:RNA polymerase sigma-70 factor [Puia dinghuensis]
MTAESLTYLQSRIARFDDQTAYKELFTTFYSPLFLFAKSMIKSKESAEEIVSDVFIRIWERRRQLEKIENLKVYLYVSVRNAALNHLSQQKRTGTNPLEEFHAEFTSIYFDPEQLLITADMLAFIKKAIDQLPPKCKIIFKLVKEDGLKYREVAEILNLSVKTVENQVAIALQKIGNTVSFDVDKTIPFSVKNHS